MVSAQVSVSVDYMDNNKRARFLQALTCYPKKFSQDMSYPFRVPVPFFVRMLVCFVPSVTFVCHLYPF